MGLFATQTEVRRHHVKCEIYYRNFTITIKWNFIYQWINTKQKYEVNIVYSHTDGIVGNQNS